MIKAKEIVIVKQGIVVLLTFFSFFLLFEPFPNDEVSEQGFNIVCDIQKSRFISPCLIPRHHFRPTLASVSLI